MSELADDGIPVTVTCRVLKLAREPYYRWLTAPVTDREWDEAHLANALFDAQCDDPEFGYRFLADEVHDAGHAVCERTVWKRCSENGWWSVFGKKKPRKRSQPGTSSHDDLVRREFTASAPNQLWLADITEHRTDEGKLYLCAIKDVFSNRIVGWSIDSRMKARLVVAAIETAVARRGDVAGCILHSDRGSQFRARKAHRALTVTAWSDPWAASARQLTTRRRNRPRAAPTQRPRPSALGDPQRLAHRDRHLDRTHLSPSTPTGRPRTIDPDRIRDHHDRPAAHAA